MPQTRHGYGLRGTDWPADIYIGMPCLAWMLAALATWLVVHGEVVAFCCAAFAFFAVDGERDGEAEHTYVRSLRGVAMLV